MHPLLPPPPPALAKSSSYGLAALKDDGSASPGDLWRRFIRCGLFSSPALVKSSLICLCGTQRRRLRHHLGQRRYSSAVALLLPPASVKFSPICRSTEGRRLRHHLGNSAEVIHPMLPRLRLRRGGFCKPPHQRRLRRHTSNPHLCRHINRRQKSDPHFQ